LVQALLSHIWIGPVQGFLSLFTAISAIPGTFQSFFFPIQHILFLFLVWAGGLVGGWFCVQLPVLVTSCVSGQFWH
jgi:hypothetical protein